MTTVPLSGTNIRIMSGVPFHNDYKNTRWFDTRESQTQYFQQKPLIYWALDHTFQRIEGKHYISVKKSIDELWGANYLMFQNSHYNSKWFYAFVTKLEYVNPLTTYVHFEIDVFQTWFFDVKFKPSFIVREHCKLWNDDGTPVINTVDEGLHYGNDYETVSVKHYEPTGDILFLVIVTKEVMHDPNKKIEPTYNGTPQPLSYYVHPFRLNVNDDPILMIDGKERSLSNILDVLRAIFSHEDAVNNVVSLYVTDYIGRYTSYSGGVVNLDGAAFQSIQMSDNKSGNWHTVYVKNIGKYDSITVNVGYKYDWFTPGMESKLLMYPYAMTVIDDLKGNRIEVKNEYIKGLDLVLRTKGSLGTSNKVAYSVDNYLTGSDLTFEEQFKLSLEKSLISNNPNDISILNDYLSAYLQGNRNQIENQKSAIMFNGTVGALTGGMVGGAQSTWVTKTGMLANPVGIAAAGAQVATGVGNAIIEMQGLQAKQRDINNIPAQMVKMGGNSAFDYGNDYRGVYIIRKQITPEYKKKLTDFFNMFGYKVNEVKVPNFHTRKHWNYVQTSNCNILGNLNNQDLQELKNVFDNGITLWHTDDVGNYSLVNEVIM